MELPHEAFLTLASIFLCVVGGIVILVIASVIVSDILPTKKRK